MTQQFRQSEMKTSTLQGDSIGVSAKDGMRRRLGRGTQPGRANNSGKHFTTESQPRTRGRPKGAQNYFTRDVKEAIINACSRHGQDGKGKGGLEGYLFRLARDEPKTMGMLLRAVLPTQIAVERVEPLEPYTSFEELQEQLAQVGFVLERAPLPQYKGPEIVLDAPNDAEIKTEIITQ